MKLPKQQLVFSLVERAKESAQQQLDEEATQLFERSISLAESIAGEDSPLLGQVLVEYFEFLSSRGKDEEANVLWERVRQIITKAMKTTD